MNKDPNFIGQPVLSQVLKFLPSSEELDKLAQELGVDRYVKKFTAKEHLVTFIFGIAGRLQSIRELNTALAAHEHKLQHLGINASVARSTFSDANKRRNPEYFKRVYELVLKLYDQLLSDSCLSSREQDKRKRLYAMDSTTVPLFTSIFQGTSKENKNGKRKGGLKIHTVIDTYDCVPRIVHITDAIRSDSKEAKSLLELPQGSTVVLDRGYYDFALFEKLNQQGIQYVTRIKQNISYDILKDLTDTDKDPNTSLDYEIKLAINRKNEYKITENGHTCRLLAWYNKETQHYDAYITSLNDISGEEIHNIYASRWKIECLFKKLKQGFSFTSLFSDNRNGIMIQIWCILITFLLLEIIHLRVKRKIPFSVMLADLRITLMTYYDFIKFLNDPDKAKRNLANKQRGKPPKEKACIQPRFDF